jgi:hypothetical protein
MSCSASSHAASLLRAWRIRVFTVFSGNAEDLRDLGNRLAVVIYEIDHFGLLSGKAAYHPEQSLPIG